MCIIAHLPERTNLDLKISPIYVIRLQFNVHSTHTICIPLSGIHLRGMRDKNEHIIHHRVLAMNLFTERIIQVCSFAYLLVLLLLLLLCTFSVLIRHLLFFAVVASNNIYRSACAAAAAAVANADAFVVSLLLHCYKNHHFIISSYANILFSTTENCAFVCISICFTNSVSNIKSMCYTS